MSSATFASSSSSPSSSYPSAGPSTPLSSVGPSCSSSSSKTRPTHTRRRTKLHRNSHSPSASGKDDKDKSILSLEVWRSTFLDSFPVLSPLSQSYVDDWLADGVWRGPVSIFAFDTSDSEGEDEDEGDCSVKRSKPKTKTASKGKGKVKDADKEAIRARRARKEGSFWNQIKTHSNSLDVDAVRAADSHIVHSFLRSLGAPEDVFLFGTKFSGVLFPMCSCHSKAKVADSLKKALEAIGLVNFNIHEFERVIFPVEMRNRWFAVLVTQAWVIVYDPAGFCRQEPELVQQLADHVGNSFIADTGKWPNLKDVPESLETRIISPDDAIDPTGSAVLVCAALELMVELPIIDSVYYPGLEVSLWFLSESIHRKVSHDRYRRLMAIGFKEAEANTKPASKGAAKALSTPGVATSKPRPRIDAPKVPFKAKRRTKRKKVPAPGQSVARHEVSPELAAALRATEKQPADGPKLEKVLLDRIIWTCKTGQLPGAMCTCALCCDDILGPFAGLL